MPRGENVFVQIGTGIANVPDPISYPGAWPESIAIFDPRATGRSMSGVPIGRVGKARAELRWSFGMSVLAYQWWRAKTAASVSLSCIVLPYPDSTTTVTVTEAPWTGVYPNHGRFSGIMERIERLPGSETRWLNGAQWVSGPLIVRLWELEPLPANEGCYQP